MSRRELLTAGGIGALGLSLGDWLRAEEGRQAASPGGSFGRAKRCILLYLMGAASQIETFDPKPEAPTEVRGQLGTTSTSVPGLTFCEHLPHSAAIADRCTVVRSMTHPYPIHGVAYAVTSIPELTVPIQLNARDRRNWPFIGSVVDYLEEQESGGAIPNIPRNIALPWLLSSRRDHPSRNAGPYGHFLGSEYDPVWTQFTGEATSSARYLFNGKISECLDPYGGIKPDCRFAFGSGEAQSADLTLDRLHRRRSLLEQFEKSRRGLERNAQVRGLDRYRSMAFSLLSSSKSRNALDVHQESDAMRARYGMTLFGQASLVARRLIEAGSRFVTVFWDEYVSVNSAWDTHFSHYPRMKQHLLPGFDKAFSALVLDLAERGMLDDTIVAVVTEHGRTPKIDTNVEGGGRNHWSQAYSSIFAGGGFGTGNVVGKTDRIAGHVVDNPVSPKDILATIYHLLGYRVDQTIYDDLKRPHRLAGEGRVRHELLA